MRHSARRLGLCLLFFAGIVCWAAGASQASPEPELAGQFALAGGLVVPGVQSLDDGQQVKAQIEADRVSPTAVAERMASQTHYERLAASTAARLAAEVFPTAVENPAGGLPSLGHIGKITRYIDSNAAAFVLARGGHGIVESFAPIAIKNSGGQFSPLDLALNRTADGFEPARSLVSVRIPKHIGAGVQLSRVAVSLTPVSAAGASLAAHEGVVDGASVFYANAEPDTDMLIKPTTLGFDASALLRSVRSPRQLEYRISVPSGATLAQDSTGAIQVLMSGSAIATILPPHAQDAADTDIPVSVRLRQHLLTLTVRTAAAQYPILVDPNVIEDRDTNESGKPSNWVYKHNPPICVGSNWCKFEYPNEYTIVQARAFKKSETASLSYSTQGDSRIYEATASLWGDMAGYPVEAAFQIFNSQKAVENGSELLWANTNFSSPNATIKGACTAGSCPNVDERGTENNSLVYGLATAGEGSCCGVTIALENAIVHIAQETGPALTLFTVEEVNGKLNVFSSGQKRWLGPHSNNAFEFQGHDPGTGISEFSVETSGGAWSEKRNLIAEKLCGGVQCEPFYDPVFGYVAGMPAGEHALLARVEDAAGFKAEIATPGLKVDATPRP